MTDAYYPIPIKMSDRKYLGFQWDDQLYEFTCLPSGLSCAPHKFTKFLRPPLAWLHKQVTQTSYTNKFNSIAHLDDLYLQGQSYGDCVKNAIDTTVLLDKLGFTVHPEKSIFVPSEAIVILGSRINFVTMSIQLTRVCPCHNKLKRNYNAGLTMWKMPTT